MGEYLLRLVIMLPLMGGLIWGSLWLWKRMGGGLPVTRSADLPATLVQSIPMGAAGRLAVVEFGGRTLLVAASRQGIALVATADGEFADD